MGSPQKIINRAKRRTDYFRMGRAEAQVACQYNRVVLTIASLLPNASGGVYVLPNVSDRFLCLYASIDYVKGINLGSPRVPETVKWDGVGLIVYKRDATGRSGTTPIPCIVSLHRLSRKRKATEIIVHYCKKRKAT